MTQMVRRESSPLASTAHCLFLDSVTASVVNAWRAHGIESILIKGPTVAEWLYRDDRVRGYGDSDLFVGPADIPAAFAVLRDLEFVRYEPPGAPPSKHTTNWRRNRDDAEVDLHHALFGAWVPPGRQWEVLRADYTEPMRVGGTTVCAPTAPARALLVALHAAQHREHGVEKPLEDLRRAIAIDDHEMWEQAAALADELDAVRHLADGLALDPDGKQLALTLRGPGAYLRAPAFARSGVVWIERVAGAESGRSRLRVVRDAIFPRPNTLRRWMPLARRGRRGLVAAYVVRNVGIVLNAVPVAISWYRARVR
jgi:hypothetical protein